MTDHNPIEGTTALNMLLYMVPMPLYLSVAGGVGVGYAFALCRRLHSSDGRGALKSSIKRSIALTDSSMLVMSAAERAGHLKPSPLSCVAAESDSSGGFEGFRITLIAHSRSASDPFSEGSPVKTPMAIWVMVAVVWNLVRSTFQSHTETPTTIGTRTLPTISALSQKSLGSDIVLPSSILRARFS